MIDERTAIAAILGQLIPAFEYAAPVLLDRLDNGLPLVARKSPSTLGFDIGMIDSRTLELFRDLAPLVTAAVNCGIVVILHNRSQAESRAALTRALKEEADLQRSVDAIVRLLSARTKEPVPQSYVEEAIQAAIAQMSKNES
jgi:hypothetical protein